MILKRLFPLAFLLFLTASAIVAQAPVIVANRATDPIPVKVVNDTAKRAHHVGVDLAFPITGEYPTVPAGRTFVVEYISGRLRTFNSSGAATCKPFDIAFDLRPDSESTNEVYTVVPTYMGTGQGVSGDVNLFSVSQPVTIYIAGGSTIAPNLSFGPACTAPIVQGRVVFSGYLVRTN